MASKKNKRLSSLQTYINLNDQESEDSAAAAFTSDAAASAVNAASGSKMETDGGVTYFVNEEGHYYYQPSGESQNLVPLPTYVSEGTREATDGSSADKIDYQTVTLGPSESKIGEVSYILVVQDDKKLKGIDINDSLDDDNQDNENSNAVYNFADDEEPKDEIQDKDVIKAPSLPSDAIKRGYLRQHFTCHLCSYTSYKRYLVLRHMKCHSKERPHKCLICEHGFKTTTSLQNHVNIHNGIKPHICKHCNSTFRTSGELVRHIKYRHTHEKLHKCNECDYASVELSKLRRHIHCHTGERPYQCPHCTYAAADTFKLKRHLRTHTGEKPYKCDLCHKCFTQSNSLKAHKLIHNVSEKPVYACELCPANCGRKTDLRKHVQKLHTSDKPLKCKKCGKCFPDKYTCKMHNKTHEGEKCFKCDLCPYASTTLRQLRSHTLKHTDEKPFVCNLCEHSFRQKQLLRRHQNLYHNPNYSPKPPKEKTHTCYECSRTFARKGNLIRHLAIHDAESGYHERVLALRLGRQKKVITVNGQIKRQMNDSDKEEMSAKMNNEEKLTVAGGDGQLDTEQQVSAVAPEHIPEEDQDKEEMDEDELIGPKIFLDFKKGEDRRKMLERSNKLEKDVDTCFGFNDEEEPGDDINFNNDSAVLSII